MYIFSIILGLHNILSLHNIESKYRVSDGVAIYVHIYIICYYIIKLYTCIL